MARRLLLPLRMKNKTQITKTLTLDAETIRVLDAIDLDHVRGGEGEGDELAAFAGPTAEAHSCNPACGPA